MAQYMYEGPIMSYGKVLHVNWSATTVARTKEEAKRNFLYRAKRRCGLLPSAKITLPNEIKDIT